MRAGFFYSPNTFGFMGTRVSQTDCLSARRTYLAAMAEIERARVLRQTETWAEKQI